MNPHAPSLPFAPWHMWGTTSQIRVDGTGLFNRQTAQLARVNYKRPETWAFWLGARVIDGPAPAVDPGMVNVNFHVIAGIGRSLWNTNNGGATGGAAFQPSFCRMAFRISSAPANSASYMKWTCTTRPPFLDDFYLAPGSEDFNRPAIDHFPAQDIQCSAVINLEPGYAATDYAVVEVGAFFAPMSHVRPDWFNEQNQFPGSEAGGT